MSVIYSDPLVLWARLLRRTVRSDSGCWIFTGSIISTGYGCVGSGAKSRNILTHRLAVIIRDGSIPEGMTVDHACHDSYVCTEKPCPHRRCVNPSHLRVMSGAANTARQWDRGTCRKGHALYLRADRGSRRCRTCQNEYAVRYRAARAGDAALVRSWAESHGLDVGAHGPISQTVARAYALAQMGSAA